MATQKKIDADKVKEYLNKLDIASKANEVDPYETREQQLSRINKIKAGDVAYFVKKYLPHYAEADCAQFQIDFCNMVIADPFFKGFAEWGRGLAKSVYCDVIIPLLLWCMGEDVFLCLMSDSKERAEELLMDIQAELEGNPLLIHDFGVQKSEGAWSVGNFKTIDQRFIGMAFGVKKKVRGVRVKHRRPTLWVIDDLETPDTISNPKRMRKQASIIERDVIPTMTSAKNRRMLYANNRFARVMTQTILQENHPHFVVHQVKAYNKVTYEPTWNYYTADYYKQLEKDIGIIAAYAEYLHETILEGTIFSEKLIQWGKLPPLEEFKAIVSHWDIAYTNNETSDYNAVKIWGLHEMNFWLIDCYVKQSKMIDAVRWMCDFKKRLDKSHPGVKVLYQYESQFWNGEVHRAIGDAQDEANCVLHLYSKTIAKIQKFMRIISMSPYYQNSRLYYNEALKSNNDCQVGIMQLCSIEEGSSEHDDSPDADQIAIETLENYTRVNKNKDKKSGWRMGKIKLKFKLP